MAATSIVRPKDWQALYRFRESAGLWPGNEEAQTGIWVTQVDYATAALRKGDLDLAEDDAGVRVVVEPLEHHAHRAAAFGGPVARVAEVDVDRASRLADLGLGGPSQREHRARPEGPRHL